MTRTIQATEAAITDFPLGRVLGRIAQFLLWSMAFGIAFTQWPLYSENQNTKFLQGLAAAGYGQLQFDWLANTIDPLPVFSALVYFTVRFFHENFFYLYHALLLGVYLYSLGGIASRIFPLDTTRVGRPLFFTLIIMLHASLLPPFSQSVMGTSLGWLLQSGVANQYLLNPVLQPSTFGVLLILSIYLFLAEQPYWAAAGAALAAVFHSTYLPSAAILTASYMLIVLWRERNLSKAFLIGLVALLLVLPVLAYNSVALGPTNAELWQRAQDIIVNFRIPHHSIPALWLDNTVYVKIGLVLLALLVVRGTRLFPILLLSLVAAVGLTLLQMRIDNDTLAFIAPWRISVFLVPLSTALLIAYGIASLLARAAPLPRPVERLALAGCMLLLALSVGRGALAVQDSFAARQNDSQAPLWHFARANVAPGDVYLTPSFMAEFRLATGAPVVVTFKSHPYKDVEVIEWQERLAAVNDFYAQPTCEGMQEMASRYGVTHVVMEWHVLEQHPHFAGCPALRSVHTDDRFSVYRIQSG
jgi:hypothetical protein